MPFSKLFKKRSATKPAKQKNNDHINQRKKKEQQRIATRKGEIGEYKIDIQLSQLPKHCKFISDLMIPNARSRSGYSQIDHVILTPYGLFVIETKNYQGQISGKRVDKKWRQNGKFEVYNPFLQNFGHIQALKSQLTVYKDIHFVSMISFTRRCTFKVDPELRKIQSDELIVYDTELSEFIHRKLTLLPKMGVKPCLTEEEISEICETLKNANITDPKIRQEHIEKAKVKRTRSDKMNDSIGNTKCAACGKNVSEKVKIFCLGNKKRFGGKIYCFEHQKK